MTLPLPVQELLETFARCRDMFNTLDVGVLARAERLGYSIQSARLTLASTKVVPPADAIIHKNWFAARVFLKPDKLPQLLEWTVRGSPWQTLFETQPGPFTSSNPPQGWHTNGLTKWPSTLHGPNGVSLRIGAHWSTLFASAEEFRNWENEVNASTDLLDIHDLKTRFGFRQDFTSHAIARQLQVEAEFPAYPLVATIENSKTTIALASPLTTLSSWSAKWREGSLSGTSSLSPSMEGATITINGEHEHLALTLVHGTQALLFNLTAQRIPTTAAVSSTESSEPHTTAQEFQPDDTELDTGRQLQQQLFAKAKEPAFEVDDGEDAAPQNITIPYDPSKTVIDTKPMSLDLLVRRLRHDEIDLAPEFQRLGGLWSDERASRLIESILIRIPLSVFYFDASVDKQWLVIDGLQRLTTLKRFIIDSSLQLQRLEYLKHLEGKTFGELPRDLQRRIEETQVTVHLIQPGTPPDVKYNIFRRINTGGLVLTPQEIRHAMNRGGPANQFLLELAQMLEFLLATGDSVPIERMEDRELVLRFIAFSHTPYLEYGRKVRLDSLEAEENLDLFLTRHMTFLNQASKEQLDQIRMKFRHAMRLAYGIFGDDAFRKRYEPTGRRNPLNKALFDAWSTVLGALPRESGLLLIERSEHIKQEFRTALKADRFFDQSVTQGTGDPRKVAKRFQTIEGIVASVLRGAANAEDT
jgi:Protein of unknown function DUF262